MGSLIIVVLLIMAICLLVWCVNTNNNDQMINTIISVIVCVGFTAVILTACHLKSFFTYLDMAGRLATIEQYKKSIDMYSEKALAEFDSGMEITDLKYNNYQDQIGTMVRELRNTIVLYNLEYAKKLILKDTFLFGWFIYLPDGMKPLLMDDYI